MKRESEKSKRIKAPRPTRLLVPTDFSRNAEEALRFAVPLARQLGGKITLLHSIDWQVNPQMRSAHAVIDTMNKVAKDAAEDRLESLARTKVPQELLEKTIVEVYLCWLMDEADIDHWHGVNDGFAGRKPIDKNFVDNHRGDRMT
jgi:nucleotide-binding universal stress UspA family protein